METPSIFVAPAVLFSTRSMTGKPIFPPTSVGRPASLKILPTSVVVVVLPFDPVIATIFPCRNRLASSTSPIMGIPNALVCCTSGVSVGTPGDTTIKSCRRNVSNPCPPDSTMIPASSSAGISCASATALRASLTVTRAPRARRNIAADKPDLPSPTTNTLLFFNSIIAFTSSPQLQRSQRKQCKHQRQNPEPSNHLRLRPTHQLKVMVQRSHLKDAFPIAQLIAPHLQHHAHRLKDKYPANKW